LDQKNGRIINLGGKNTAMMDAGDRIVVQSPGGGGWGRCTSEVADRTTEPIRRENRGFLSVANGTVDIIQSMGESA
jgi:5-oxoprolinase (ATP-hydrolysing)